MNSSFQQASLNDVRARDRREKRLGITIASIFPMNVAQTLHGGYSLPSKRRGMKHNGGCAKGTNIWLIMVTLTFQVAPQEELTLYWNDRMQKREHYHSLVPPPYPPTKMAQYDKACCDMSGNSINEKSTSSKSFVA